MAILVVEAGRAEREGGRMRSIIKSWRTTPDGREATALLCGHPLRPSSYDPARDNGETYDCKACESAKERDLLHGRFGVAFRGLLRRERGEQLECV